MVSGTKCSSNGVAACLTTKAVRGDLGVLFHLASGSRPRQCLRAFRERTDLDFRKVGLGVPRADARWMGDLLAHLSPQQIRDAFRAAGYSSGQVEGFGEIVEKRIAELLAL